MIIALLCLFAAPSDGQVLKYVPDRQLVGISLGEREGVKEGERLLLWRGGDLLGMCQVIKVGSSVSFCRLLSLKRGSTPGVGDQVMDPARRPPRKVAPPESVKVEKPAPMPPDAKTPTTEGTGEAKGTGPKETAPIPEETEEKAAPPEKAEETEEKVAPPEEAEEKEPAEAPGEETAPAEKVEETEEKAAPPEKAEETEEKAAPPEKTEEVSAPAEEIKEEPPAKQPEAKAPSAPSPSKERTGVKEMPPPRPKEVPALSAMLPELLALGVTSREMIVSSTDGLYVFAGGGMVRDDSILPHEILRFVPWGDRLWAETNGGVFLREKGNWRKFPWSEKFRITRLAFARVGVKDENAWGIFGTQLFVWNPRSETLEYRDGKARKTQGDWEKLGDPFGAELQTILPLSDKQLLVATAERKLLLKEGAKLATLASLDSIPGDPRFLEFARDSQGSTWILSFAGEGGEIFRLTKQGMSLMTRGRSALDKGMLPPGSVRRLLADARGRVLALNATEGLYRHHLERWERVGARPAEIAVDVAVAPDGAIYLLTEKRLVRLEPGEKEIFAFEGVAGSEKVKAGSDRTAEPSGAEKEAEAEAETPEGTAAPESEPTPESEAAPEPSDGGSEASK